MNNPHAKINILPFDSCSPWLKYCQERKKKLSAHVFRNPMRERNNGESETFDRICNFSMHCHEQTVKILTVKKTT